MTANPKSKIQNPKSYNLRVVGTDDSTLTAELERVGAQVPGQQIMWRKASFLPIRLEGLTCVGANVLKQEMLARGGDCAVHRDCLTLDRDQTSALLIGTRAQYDDLREKLHEQAFGLPEVAEQLSDLLESLDTPLKPLQLGRYTLPIDERTLVMGILNVTPDSFSSDSLGDDVDAAIEQARRMRMEGADILDVGGQSTRPGSDPVPEEEELHRVLPVVERLVGPDGVDLPISVDTSRVRVGRGRPQSGRAHHQRHNRPARRSRDSRSGSQAQRRIGAHAHPGYSARHATAPSLR